MLVSQPDRQKVGMLLGKPGHEPVSQAASGVESMVGLRGCNHAGALVDGKAALLPVVLQHFDLSRRKAQGVFQGLDQPPVMSHRPLPHAVSCRSQGSGRDCQAGGVSVTKATVVGLHSLGVAYLALCNLTQFSNRSLVWRLCHQITPVQARPFAQGHRVFLST
jgi:hypothetical protein